MESDLFKKLIYPEKSYKQPKNSRLFFGCCASEWNLIAPVPYQHGKFIRGKKKMSFQGASMNTIFILHIPCQLPSLF